jgi:hypothetical protein
MTAIPDLHHVAAEQALLGSMLSDQEACSVGADLVDAGSFYDPLHSRIFTATRDLLKENGRVLLTELKGKMNGDPGLKAMSQEPDLAQWGGDYLSMLLAAAPSVPWVHEQAAIIKQSAARRAALKVVTSGDPVAALESGRLFTVHRAIDAMTAPLATDYLIKRLLVPGEFSCWYGPPASGKSFAVLHACYAICQGREVFGRRVRPAPVLYVCLEGETNFAKRLRAIATVYGQPASFFYIAERADFYETDADIEGVILAATQVGARLVVIDTLARVMGGGSENEGRDMARMIHCFDRIKRETGAHICVVHHTGKDTERGMRGHSNLLAAADVTVEIRRDEEGGRTLRVAKAKDDEEGQPQGFTLKVVEVGTDEDGEAITSCVIAEAGAVEKPNRAAQLTSGEAGWLADLGRIFDDHDGGGFLVPASGMTAVQCITREQARDGFRKQGRFTASAGESLTGADREKMRAALTKLKDKKKIGMTETHIWLVRVRQ